MKLLILTEDFPPMPGGIAAFLSELCRGLIEREHEIDILADEMPDCAQYDSKRPYSVIRYPVPGRLGSVRIGYHLLKQIIKKKPDIIFLGHVFSTRGLIVLLIKWLLRIPYVILIHGGHLPHARRSRINRIAVFSLLRHANLLLSNSKFTRKLLIEEDIPQRKIEILYPGVDIDYFSPVEGQKEIEEIRKTYCDVNTFLIVNAARLVPKKNHIRIINAISSLIKKEYQVKCVIAGEGPEREKLEKLIESLGLSNEVILAGNLDRRNVLNLFRSADVVALPSTLISEDGHHESFGIVAIEAAACGKPVIVGSLGGQPETVIHRETGFVIDGDDFHTIEEAIERLMEDKVLAKKMGDAGRKRAVEEFSWEGIAAKTEKMLDKVI